jgi:hypothetical protein
LKDGDSRVFTRMLQKEGRTGGSVTISHRNFVGKGIIKIHYVPGYSTCICVYGAV